MKCNIGGWDRFFRFIVGFGILVMGYVYDSYWGLIGLVPVLTALIKWCPLYIPFNKSTFKEGSCGATGASCCCNKDKK